MVGISNLLLDDCCHTVSDCSDRFGFLLSCWAVVGIGIFHSDRVVHSPLFGVFNTEDLFKHWHIAPIIEDHILLSLIQGICCGDVVLFIPPRMRSGADACENAVHISTSSFDSPVLFPASFACSLKVRNIVHFSHTNEIGFHFFVDVPTKKVMNIGSGHHHFNNLTPFSCQSLVMNPCSQTQLLPSNKGFLSASNSFPLTESPLFWLWVESFLLFQSFMQFVGEVTNFENLFVVGQFGTSWGDLMCQFASTRIAKQRLLTNYLFDWTCPEWHKTDVIPGNTHYFDQKSFLGHLWMFRTDLEVSIWG